VENAYQNPAGMISFAFLSLSFFCFIHFLPVAGLSISRITVASLPFQRLYQSYSTYYHKLPNDSSTYEIEHFAI
jgi:hypothetical protein